MSKECLDFYSIKEIVDENQMNIVNKFVFFDEIKENNDKIKEIHFLIKNDDTKSDKINSFLNYLTFLQKEEIIEKFFKDIFIVNGVFDTLILGIIFKFYKKYENWMPSDLEEHFPFTESYQFTQKEQEEISRILNELKWN